MITGRSRHLPIVLPIQHSMVREQVQRLPGAAIAHICRDPRDYADVATPPKRTTPQSDCGGLRWPQGNTQRKVLRTGRLHQQSSAQPHSTAPMPSTNRPITAKSR
jgi:hypothetical protein